MPVTRFYYFMDPMCGWCYGFSGTIAQLRSNFPEIPMEIICGGMVPPAAEGPVGEKGKYIIPAIHRVEKLSGIAFGDSYKEKIASGNIWNGSYKPSAFLCSLKHFDYSDLEGVFADMQHLHFHEGMSLQEDQVYAQLLRDTALDPNEILKDMDSMDRRNQVMAEFEFTASIGISGFPTLVCESDEKLMLLSYGYSDYNSIAGNLDRIMQGSEVN